MPKVLIASGGTGGHIFPAQILALELLEVGYEILFSGAKLSSNRYFHREKFPYKEVASAALSWKGLWPLLKGAIQSFKVLSDFQPDCVVGFGSFYSFPVLLAARMKKIPLILFEPNAFPGKVNRFFSRWAAFSAVQFSEAGKLLKGNILEVKMPTGKRKKTPEEEARDYFYLDPKRFTFLVFGGSQGAESINHMFSEAVRLINKDRDQFQVIHVAGKSDRAEVIRKEYERAGIKSCVKAFEERMDLAWSAANFVICRSGAATVAEQIAFEVPGILIPFPRAADDHQTKNALFMEKIVGGALTCPELALSGQTLKETMEYLCQQERLQGMQSAIRQFKHDDQKADLCSLICSFIKGAKG
jgi:UDP-N-acetylglucosamine--N-acetylmuramyl-(pentapeptide) pyrophosphoryl-undecaprenol N-acetylglucosamine transferase